MNWKTDYRSIYYLGAPEPDDLDLKPAETALLVIDVQNTYRQRPGPGDARARRAGAASTSGRRSTAGSRLTSFPTPRTFLPGSARKGMECVHARIAMPHAERAGALAQPPETRLERPPPPKDDWPSQIVPELAALPDEIVVTKMTDSAVTGTNLRLLLANMGIRNVVCCGVFTDQCVSSTVRSLADESFNVVVVEDCCAAGSEELHHKELEIINMIYCNVMSAAELKAMMGL